MGLVEVGVGLIPAGGGCKEMLLRSHDVKKVFEQIGFAKVSTSAVEARQFRYLRDGDGISMNPERLIDDAKATGALAGARLCAGRAAHRYRGVGRRGLRADEDGRLDGAAGRLHFGITTR